jgi:amino acid adenylation domain-containing protein
MTRNTSDTPRPVDDREIAIVGIGSRFPQADGVAAYWEMLQEGRDTLETLNDAELRAAGVTDALIADPAYVRRAAVIEGIDQFDPDFFGLSPAEAAIMDPQIRVFLECAHDALAQAGLAKNDTPRSVGVFAGSGSNGYFLNNIMSNPQIRETFGDFQTMLANDKDYLATQVSYRLNLTGPSMTVQTACSTSLVAVHLACQSLLEGECDYAMAGGVAIAPAPLGYLYQPGMILSPDGHCRPFSDQAAGTLNGAGAGIVLLQALDQALAKNAQIYGIIRASAINNDGVDKIGYTAPSVDGQARVIAEAQEIAGVAPHEVGFVEAHGTATDLGDKIEVAALARVWGQDPAAQSSTTYLGSVKSNMGHAGVAAGIAGLIKATLAVNTGQIPATLYHERAHTDLGLDALPFAVNSDLMSWPDACNERVAGVSSFGIGGTNAHVIVAENRFATEPAVRQAGPVSETPALWTFSGETAAAARRHAAALSTWADRLSAAELSDAGVALWQAQVPSDGGLAWRGVAVGRTSTAMADALGAAQPVERGKASPQPLFLFSGHGGQTIGMASELYRLNPVFRACCDEHETAFLKATGHTLGTFFQKDSGAPDLLDRMQITQPLMYIVQVALAALWASLGVRPVAVTGHSSGEYAAAAVAGVFSVADGLALVAARGRLMDQTEPGAMAALAYSPAEIKSVLPDDLEISVINGPEMCVVAGPTKALADFETTLDSRDVEYAHLHVSLAAHSPTMDPFVAPLREEASKIAMTSPSLRYVSAMLGHEVSAEVASATYWGDHLRQPVRFDRALAALESDNADYVYIEIGPSNVLSQILGSNISGATCMTSLPHPKFETADDLQHFYAAAGRLWALGGSVDLASLMPEGDPDAVQLPNQSPFQRQRCWIDAQPQQSAPVAVSQLRKPHISDWFSVPSCQRAAPFGHGNEAPESVVVFNAPETARDAIMATVGDAKVTWQMTPVQDYAQVLRAHSPDLILDFTDLEPVDDADLPHAFEHVARLGQGLIAHDHPARLVIFTNNLTTVTGHETIRPDASLLLGPAMVLPQESPELRVSLVDLDPQDQNLDQLAKLIGCPHAHGVEAWRGVFRWTPTLAALPIPSAGHGLRHGGAYLFTGGLGGLSLTIIRRLIRDGIAPRLALLTRRAVPDRSDWPSDPVFAKLLTFEDQGAEVAVFQGDVADADVMAGVMRDVRDRFGSLAGVFHTAGDIGLQIHNALGDFSPQMAQRQLRAKRDGAMVLRDVLDDQPLDFVVLFSSLASVLGGLGFAAYSAANAYLDAMAASQRQAGAPWLSVNIDAWMSDDKDSDTPELARTFDGIQMGPDDGYTALMRALTMDDAAQIMMSPSDVAARHRLWVTTRRPIEKDLPATSETPALADVAGMTTIETQVAEIWAGLLGHGKITPDDNFLALGGHSLLATRLIAQVKARFDVAYPLRQIFDAPTLREMAAFIAAAAPAPASDVPDHAVSTGAAWSPLSAAQQQMLFSEHSGQGDGLYHVPMALHLTGALDQQALCAAFSKMCERHWIFRARVTTLEGETGIGAGDVAARVMAFYDYSGADVNDLRPVLDAEALRPFDVHGAPLIRAALYQLGPQEHLVQIVQHHLITDGWSSTLMLQELFELYAGPLPTWTEKDFADHVAWERAKEKAADTSQLTHYWQTTLADLPATHAIPLDQQRKAARAGATQTVSHQFDPDLARRVQEWASEQGASLFMVLLANFNALLYRLTGQSDTAIVTVSANRKEAWQEQVMGLLAAPIVVRAPVDPSQDFSMLVGHVRSAVLSAFDHDALPLHRVVEAINPPRQTGQHPLSQIGFVVQNFPLTTVGQGALAVQTLPSPPLAHEFDLLVSFVSSGDDLTMFVEYASDLFSHQRMADLVAAFADLLEQVIDAPDQKVSAMSLPASTTQAWLEWATPERAKKAVPLFHALVQDHASTVPDNIALIAGSREISYAELEAAIDVVKAKIGTVQAGDRIAVACADRVQRVVAFLAILQLGAVYVPLDPSHPKDRHQVILQDAAPICVLEDDGIVQLGQGDADLREQADGLAYILYTSGTTGTPKGVMITPENLANMAAHQDSLCPDGPPRVLQLAAPSFDAWIWEVCLALGQGGTLVLPAQVAQPMGDDLAELINVLGVSHLTITPPALSLLPQGSYPSLHVLITAGAAISPELAEQWGQGRRLINGYGPTETTICSTLGSIGTGPVMLGDPFGGHRLRVLDADGQQVQPGYVGELLVGGPGLARGYWRRPDLTTQQFVRNPLTDDQDDLLYRTGDLVQVHANPYGLSFVGRADDQLKLRGIRVELKELAAQIMRNDDVTQAAVIAVPKTDPTALVAVVVGDASVDALQQQLAQRLPQVLVPRQIIHLDEMPLTTAGKVDQQALYVLWESQPVAPEGPPTTPAEQRIARATREVLRLTEVDMTRSFFDLGGSSLTAVRLAQLLAEDAITLETIFAAVSLRALARKKETEIVGDPMPVGDGAGPASFWFAGVEGHVQRLSHLGTEAGKTGPVYLVPVRVVADTWATVVARQVETIRRLQPEGPYYIGGHSIGGALAYAVARELGQVARLTLLDSYAPRPTDVAPDPNAVVGWLLAQHGLTLSVDLPHELDIPLIMTGLGMDPAFEARAHEVAPLIEGALRYTQMITTAELWRAPVPLAIPTSVFRAAQTDDTAAADLGWGDYVDLPDLHVVDCDHTQILQDPHIAAVVAAWVADCTKD